MGNGSKFLKHGVKSKKPLPNGRDLSWYDKLDRNELIEEQEEKERLEKMNSGIKTGAKVWVSLLYHYYSILGLSICC